MRITKLEFENLNSLKGKWAIDFTHPEYAKNHDIFVICGPTGAGKTTLLDAITLALYGRTPRLEAINAGEGGNEIMTRGTGFCRAAVTYSCKKGVFRSEFQQNRANGRATGNLQKASFKITRLDGSSDLGELFADGGEVVATGTGSALEKETQKIIQLDYKQFCRSIMLAQGEFSAFLESNARERADILEKLTGTERYRAIGKKVADTFSEIKKNFQFCKSQKEEIESLVLGEDAEADARKAERGLSEELSRLEESLSALEKELSLFEEIDRLRGEGAALSRSIGQSESEFLRAEQNAEEAKSQLLREEADFAESQSLWKKVRELDVRIGAERQKLSESGQRKASCERALSDTERKIAALEVRLAMLEQSCAELEAYRKAHANDEKLSESLARIDALTLAFAQAQKNAAWHEGRARSLSARLESTLAERGRLEAELSALDEQIRRFVSADAVFIASLLRRELSDGKPCLVCGSPYHSAHADASADSDETADSDGAAADTSAKTVRIAEQSASLSARREELSEKISSLSARAESERANLKNAEENCSLARASTAENLAGINEILATWEETASAESLAAVVGSLQRRAADWKAKGELLAQSEGEKAAKSAEKNALSENRAAQKESLAQASADCEANFAALTALGDERNALFGAKNVDSEERQKNQTMRDLKQRFEDAQRAQNQMSEQKARLEAQKAQLEKLLLEKEGELARLQEGAESGRQKEAVLAEKNAALSQKQAASDRLISVKATLSANEQNKSRAQKILAEYEALREDYGIWEQMNKWAGQREGADLSVFVQSLAFSSLLSLANKNLFGITSRYKVAQKTPASLDFEIQDIYFDGPRSIANLSGGEKFLVSLSFALAISEFASRNVRVDSLFLDEGFGTLSGELLTEAINALRNLQKDGKMLGIITHVRGVIDEIEQKIEVKPLSLGRSELVGAGISRG